MTVVADCRRPPVRSLINHELDLNFRLLAIPHKRFCNRFRGSSCVCEADESEYECMFCCLIPSQVQVADSAAAEVQIAGWGHLVDIAITLCT